MSSPPSKLTTILVRCVPVSIIPCPSAIPNRFDLALFYTAVSMDLKLNGLLGDHMRITMLTTGGTIEKTYDEHDGSLRNARTTLPQLLSTFRLPDLEIDTRQVFFIDSLEMTDAHREMILASTIDALDRAKAVIILHGTDTLERTGELLHVRLPDLQIPVILTGAMRPYEFRDTDAAQNVTESLLAARLLEPGVYVVMHNRVLRFPGVRKNREQLTFESSQRS